MSEYSEFARAFAIFDSYKGYPQGVYAEHDEIYAGPEPEAVSEEDLAELAKLGWYPSEGECFRRFV